MRVSLAGLFVNDSRELSKISQSQNFCIRKLQTRIASSKEDEDEREKEVSFIGQLQGSRCSFKRNLLNYLSPSHTVSEKENCLQHFWLGSHAFIGSGCQRELRGGGAHAYI